MGKGADKSKITSQKSMAVCLNSGLKALAVFFIIVGRPFFKILLFIGYGLAYLLENLRKVSIFLFNCFSKIKLPQLSLSLTKAKLSPPCIFSAKTKKSTLPTPRQPKTKISRFPFRTIPYLAFLLGVFSSSCLGFYGAFVIFRDLPSPQKLSRRDQSLTTKIYDRNDTLLYKIYREKNRTPVSLKDLPTYLIQATIAIEDKDFFHHQGLSLPGIGRATFQNIFMGKKTGGSTITQQLIKNALLTSEKTWKRKIKEAVLAVLVEKRFSKNEILEMYLNEVGYGGAIYGIEEAAQKYFAKHAKDLTLAEAAFLAGLPASPTRYSPFGHQPELAKGRQALVLARMVEDKYISQEEAQKALNQKLILAPQKTEILAPHFVMYIKDLLVQKYGERTVEEGGLEVKTSLDIHFQEMAQEVVATEIKKLGNLHVTNGAALITNPQTGEILAMVGSKDYFATDIDGNVNVTTAQRQPGSSIKPVAYSIALENGFTPATLIDDSPITYQVPGQKPYSPENYDRRFHGQVTLRTALGSSYNVPAVKILAAFGVKKMVQRGREMGITTWDDPSRFGLSLTLGGGEVKMTDMAVVYGTLANNGIRVDLNPILEVKDSKGEIIEENPAGRETPVLNPAVAYLLTNILQDNAARTPAFGPGSLLNIPYRQVAVKTGTTQNLRDNWTIGYTPSRLVAIWVGNNDSSPMSYVASGITGASPIWRKIMDNLLVQSFAEEFPRPQEVEEVTICQATNTLPCQGCPSTRKELFILGTAPKNHCDPARFLNLTPTPYFFEIHD
jgi:1A family penicillin-binding protein